MSHDEMVAVIQAHKEGHPIQMRRHGWNRDQWVDINPEWDFRRADYRVKPEPREWWAVIGYTGTTARLFEQHPGLYSTKPIRVREVLE